jgi:hypothetical protein
MAQTDEFPNVLDLITLFLCDGSTAKYLSFNGRILIVEFQKNLMKTLLT